MRSTHGEVESPYAWLRLGVSLALSTIGGVGMWAVVVVLPALQQDFGVARGDASLSYTFTMIGFGLASIVMGRLADRFGIIVPVIIGAAALALGFAGAGLAPGLWLYALAQGLLIGAGSAATFAPLLAHVSLWFSRRRGIAIAIFASGNYLAGAVWPPIVQHFIQSDGWRQTYLVIGVFCVVTMVPLALLLRRPAPVTELAPTGARARAPLHAAALGLSSRTLQVLLIVAGLACCVAMSMPQVHLV